MSCTTRGLATVIGLVGLTACGSRGDAALPEGDAARGAPLYTANCASCHGAEGGGTPTGPSLLDGEVNAADVVTAVRQGVDDPAQPFGPMPAVGGLQGQDLADVVAHVLRFHEESGT